MKWKFLWRFMSESSGPKKENKSHVMKIDSPGQVQYCPHTVGVRTWYAAGLKLNNASLSLIDSR